MPHHFYQTLNLETKKEKRKQKKRCHLYIVLDLYFGAILFYSHSLGSGGFIIFSRGCKSYHFLTSYV